MGAHTTLQQSSNVFPLFPHEHKFPILYRNACSPRLQKGTHHVTQLVSNQFIYSNHNYESYKCRVTGFPIVLSRRNLTTSSLCVKIACTFPMGSNRKSIVTYPPIPSASQRLIGSNKLGELPGTMTNLAISNTPFGCNNKCAASLGTI